MKLKNDFITHTFNDVQMMVAVGKQASIFHGVVKSNKTAAFIVDCLKEETTKEAIIKKMMDKYDGPYDLISKDVDMVIAKLESVGAIE